MKILGGIERKRFLVPIFSWVKFTSSLKEKVSGPIASRIWLCGFSAEFRAMSARSCTKMG